MESLIDRKYRLLLFQCSAKPPVFAGSPSNPKWKLECPLCGAPGASLVWISSKNTYKFLCSASRRGNCGVHVEFPVLLKMWNLRLFDQYLQEREDEGTTGFGFNCPRRPPGGPSGGPQRGSRSRVNSEVQNRSKRPPKGP